MSPEQASGRTDDIDHQADQWALACIAWEMLCGHGPFVADEVTALFYQIMNLQPQSLLLKVPGLAPEAELVLLRALSKNPKQRFPSIREFAHAFEAAAMGRPADLTPLPVSLSRSPLSSADIAMEMTQATEMAAEVRQRSPNKLTTFSRTAGEMTAETSGARWSKLRSKPLYAAVALAGVVALAGGFFLFRPRTPPVAALPSPDPQSLAPQTPPSQRSAPSISPLVSPPEVVAAPPPPEAPSKSFGAKSRATRAQPGGAKDPFEQGASGDKQKRVKTSSSPSDVIHKNDTSRPASPLQPKAKRKIFREL